MIMTNKEHDIVSKCLEIINLCFDYEEPAPKATRLRKKRYMALIRGKLYSLQILYFHENDTVEGVVSDPEIGDWKFCSRVEIVEKWIEDAAFV